MAEMDASNIKRLPSGNSDFREVMTKGRYYVDKTMYLPLLENTDDFLFAARPRRFGKSMFLTMMRDYYDINRAEAFKEEFEGTWIAGHPTPLQGKCQVMFLDFSMVPSTKGKTIEEKFSNYFDSCLEQFFFDYERFYDKSFIDSIVTSSGLGARLQRLGKNARDNGYRLYLIVDEYDNFTNTILGSSGMEDYTAMTHEEGFYRDAFMSFKPNFAYIMMMGVSPMTLSDLTSGYNIATNITFWGKFNQMLGFSEDDVREMIRYYHEAGMLEMEEEDIIDHIRPWYDNYCFSKESFANGDPGMYNSNMVLRYLGKIINTGTPPESMEDYNANSDSSKLRTLVDFDKKNPDSRSVILDIATKGYIVAPLAEQVSLNDMGKEEFLPSLLTYQGALTIGSSERGDTRLVIPNKNARSQMYGLMASMYQDFIPKYDEHRARLDDNALNKGKWKELFTYVMECYHDATSEKAFSEGERVIQGFFLGTLQVSTMMEVLIEADANDGYCDVLLTPRFKKKGKHSCILELKYLYRKDSEATAKDKWEDGVAKALRHARSSKILKEAGESTLHKIVLMASGSAIQRMEEI